MLVNEGTNDTRETVSDGSGAFVFPQVEDPGVYTVKLELAGFKSVTYSDVRVSSRTEEYSLAAKLDVGDLVGDVRSAGVDSSNDHPEVTRPYSRSRSSICRSTPATRSS